MLLEFKVEFTCKVVSRSATALSVDVLRLACRDATGTDVKNDPACRSSLPWCRLLSQVVEGWHRRSTVFSCASIAYS